MSSKYVSQDEIEAHEAAMLRVVEDEKKERQAINDKKKMAIEAAQRAFYVAIKSAEDESDQELKKSRDSENKKLAAMQRDFNHLPLLRQVYHEAPDDVFELIVSEFSLQLDLHENERGHSRWGKGGLNSLRLANKRLKQVVESCTTRLTNEQKEDGPDSLPIPIIKRCGRIEVIRCVSHNLRSLEGCPDGLTHLWIGNAPHLSDLSPLKSCSRMENLRITNSSITDISAVTSMPLLEVFYFRRRDDELPSIKDLSSLSLCPALKICNVFACEELKDLSPLSECKDLEVLDVSFCRCITSLAPLSSLVNLKSLDVHWCPLVNSLAPLSTLTNLTTLGCDQIAPETSLLPLVSCTGLRELTCCPDAVDLEELRRRRPDLIVIPFGT